MVHSKKSPFQQKFQKKFCTISTGISNLGVGCIKWSHWASGVGVGQKDPTPTPSVVRNPIPPAKPPTPQPCLEVVANTDLASERGHSSQAATFTVWFAIDGAKPRKEDIYEKNGTKLA